MITIKLVNGASYMIKDVIEYFAENNRLIVLSNDITLSINSKAIAYYIVE